MLVGWGKNTLLLTFKTTILILAFLLTKKSSNSWKRDLPAQTRAKSKITEYINIMDPRITQFLGISKICTK